MVLALQLEEETIKYMAQHSEDARKNFDHRKMTIRHMTRSKEWIKLLKYILTMTLNMMKMVIIYQ